MIVGLGQAGVLLIITGKTKKHTEPLNDFLKKNNFGIILEQTLA